MNFDHQLHAFRTSYGLPPDTDTPPACGKVITRAYGVHSPKPTEKCPECDALVSAHRSSASPNPARKKV